MMSPPGQEILLPGEDIFFKSMCKKILYWSLMIDHIGPALR
jgi:hypothetical protein